MALPRALRSRERPGPGHRLAPGRVYYQQLLLLSPARIAWPQPTASPRLRLLPPLPPSPPLPRSSALAAEGHGGSQPPAWVHRPWVGGVGGGRRGKEPESGGTDGRYPVGSRGFGGEGRREQLWPLILKRRPSPRDVGLWGVTCGTRDPGLPRKVRRVRALGRLPRERRGRSRHSATSLGTLTQRSSSGSLLPAGRAV